jgi:probable HAF family extracellular repeat protein
MKNLIHTAVVTLFAASAVFMSFVAPVVAAQSITDLGVLPIPPGYSCGVWANAVSDDGVVVGDFYVWSKEMGDFSQSAFIWSSSHGMARLIDDPGVTYSRGYGISGDGKVAVGSCGSGAFRWTAQSGPQILALPDGAYEALALRCNLDGSVIVGTAFLQGTGNGFGYSRAYAWRVSAGIQLLPLLGGFPDSQAEGVSGDGHVCVGNASSEAGLYRAFRWSEQGGLSDLGTLPGGDESSAEAVNADGSVIAGIGCCDSDGRAVGMRWTPASGWQSVGLLPGFQYIYVRAVSGDGSMIVGDCGGKGLEDVGFIWQEGFGMTRLDQFLTARGVDLQGWTNLGEVGAISANGRFIVGGGTNRGQARAFIADLWAPCPADVTADRRVDGADIGEMLSEWGPANANTVSDINRDGQVNGADLGILLANWGPCPN